MTSARRMVGSLAVAAALVAGTTVLATAQASAQTQRADWDGNIYLYYSASSNSSWSKYAGWVNDFAGHTFAAGGEGHGLRVKNNVNRAWNNDGNYAARIYYNENQNASGNAPYDDFYPGESRQLNSGVRNNNASMSWWRVG
ncbi:hypothetical protein ACFYZI_31460 [Streptomyces griseorubiginosus]|uniref:Peptidase inhibitor family I36 n=2 Tax=Streptomyces griseorubiginosus TaxID=67304 RepID=A0AAI8KUM1_9ACTN|nr:hypothetical protein [Streptomyces griseorubiginosus]AYC36226.1 hypothetical protein DWG14_00434 [Streptomyces griseorubiginosus]